MFCFFCLWCGVVLSSLIIWILNAGFMVVCFLGNVFPWQAQVIANRMKLSKPSCSDFTTPDRVGSHKCSGRSWPDVGLQHYSLKSRTCKQWGHIPCW
jgi:hypothetical protein